MEIQYVIINFIILLVILILAGKKTVKRIFGGRLERINRELDEAEEIEKLDMPVFESVSAEIPEDNVSDEILNAKAHTEEKINSIKAFTEREYSEIHRQMIEDARKELFSVMKENVIKLFSYEKYANEIKELDSQVVDAILADIRLTDGDMSYLKHHDVLYVTITSAFPLEKELVDKIDKATTELLDSVGGKTSLWVLEDNTLIGGLKLRIGDTVYDGTVSEELYHFEKNMNHEPIMDDDTVSLLIQEFTQ
jgi:F0F1-type ATP synthase membrane subunit b/b'